MLLFLKYSMPDLTEKWELKVAYIGSCLTIKADNRKKQAAKALKMTPVLILLIEARILLDWSPEQVSGSLKDELGACPRISLSNEQPLFDSEKF